MIKTIIRALYSAFISVVLIAIILAGWTSYAFIFHSSKSSEINSVLKDMYASQSSFLADVIDLSKILMKDSSERTASNDNDFSEETKSISDLEDNFQINESLITEDKGENPLGIVIEPSLPELSETKLPDVVEEPLVNEQNRSSMNDMDMDMDMDIYKNT